MLPILGKTIKSLPRKIHFVRHIEYFEGPILSEYHADDGGVVYVEKWCTQTEDGGEHRFLLVRSDLRSIALYSARRIALRELLEHGSDGVGFLLDRSRMGARITQKRVMQVNLDDLPQDYMPEEDTYYDESFRPRSNRTVQSFLLGPKWSGELISAIERSFLDAAAFNRFTASNTNNGAKIPDSILRFNYRRGFPVGVAFRELRTKIPLEERDRSIGVAAGSPGVLSIDVEARIAENIMASVVGLDAALPIYNLVQAWAKQDIIQNPEIPTDAADQLRWLAESLNLDLERIGDAHERPLTIAKVLTAYVRKLKKLARPPGDAEFLGVNLDTTRLALFESDDDDE